MLKKACIILTAMFMFTAVLLIQIPGGIPLKVAEASTVTVANPGFETGGASQTPSGWSTWSPANSDADYSEFGGAKTGSYHLTHWKASAYVVTTYQTITNLNSGYYTLTAWVKSSGGQNAANMNVSGFGGATDQIWTDTTTNQTVEDQMQSNILTKAIPASSTWIQIKIPNIYVTHRQLTINFFSDANAGNWIYVDDIQLESDNKLSNPSFEADGAGVASPTGWQTSGNDPGADYTVSGADLHLGTYYATHLSNVAAYNVTTSQFPTGLSNGTYELTAWIQSSGGQTTAQMFAQSFGGTTKLLDIRDESTAWKFVKITDIQVTNGQCQIGFTSIAPAGKWIKFDDVNLVKTNNLVVNPSFENDGNVSGDLIGEGTQTPSGWWTYSSNGHADADFTQKKWFNTASIQPKSGAYRLVHWNKNAFHVETGQYISSIPSGTYVLKAWVRSSGSQSIDKMYIKDYGGAGTYTSVNIPAFTAAWKQIKISNVSITSGNVNIGFDTTSSGDDWTLMDDVELISAADDADLTTTAAQTPAQTPMNVTVPPGANIAVGKAITSSGYEGGFDPNKGNDGGYSSNWRAYSSAVNQWLTIDLGDQYTLNGAGIAWEIDGKVYKYKIEVSGDNVNWTTAVDKTTNTNSFWQQYSSFTANWVRYARITVTGLETGVKAGIREFKLYSTVPGGSLDIAVQKTATSDSSGSGTGPANAVDSNVTSLWRAANTSNNHWLTVDLGGVYNLNGSEVTWEFGGLSWGYKIETSKDNINWTMAVNKTTNSVTDWKQTDWFIQTARYVRITVTGVPSGKKAAIDEFKIYQSYYKGAEIMFQKQLEDRGAVYYDNGTQTPILDIFKNNNLNMARLEAYVDHPSSHMGKSEILTMATRIKNAGLLSMLTLYYSDEQKQWPRAWNLGNLTVLKQQMYDYTYDLILALKNQGSLPAIVAIGNESNCGLLSADVCNSSLEWDELSQLYKTGIQAVKDAAGTSNIKTMIHLGGYWQEHYDKLDQYAVPYDILGLSYYPFWGGDIQDIRDTLVFAINRHNKDVMITETAYPFTLNDGDGYGNIVSQPSSLKYGYSATKQGQAAYTRDILDMVRTLPKGRGLGVITWGTDLIPNHGVGWIFGEGLAWENNAYFDYTGHANDVLAEYWRY